MPNSGEIGRRGRGLAPGETRSAMSPSSSSLSMSEPTAVVGGTPSPASAARLFALDVLEVGLVRVLLRAPWLARLAADVPPRLVRAKLALTGPSLAGRAPPRPARAPPRAPDPGGSVR